MTTENQLPQNLPFLGIFHIWLFTQWVYPTISGSNKTSTNKNRSYNVCKNINGSDLHLVVFPFHFIPLLSAVVPAKFYHFLTWGKKNFSNPSKIADFAAKFQSQLLFHPFHSIIVALLSFWPLVFVFLYFP